MIHAVACQGMSGLDALLQHNGNALILKGSSGMVKTYHVPHAAKMYQIILL